MTTNIDRAADIIETSLAWCKCVDAEPNPSHIAEFIAAAGMVMPDLPKTQFADDGTPYWTADEEVYQPSQTRGFVDGMDAYGESFSDSVENFKKRALAMLAAVYYIERNQE